MLIFTLAPLAALLASAALTVRHGASGPMSDAQLPFLGCSPIGGSPGTFAMTGFALLPGSFEPLTQFMLPRRGVLRSLLVKNVRVGEDAVSITYRVRRDGKDVGFVTLRNDDPKPVKLNITQVGADEGALVSLLVDNPGFSGEAPLVKCVFMWRPL